MFFPLRALFSWCIYFVCLLFAFWGVLELHRAQVMFYSFVYLQYSSQRLVQKYSKKMGKCSLNLDLSLPTLVSCLVTAHIWECLFHHEDIDFIVTLITWVTHNGALSSACLYPSPLLTPQVSPPALPLPWGLPVMSACICTKRGFLLRPPHKKRVLRECPAASMVSMMKRVPNLRRKQKKTLGWQWRRASKNTCVWHVLGLASSTLCITPLEIWGSEGYVCDHTLKPWSHSWFTHRIVPWPWMTPNLCSHLLLLLIFKA